MKTIIITLISLCFTMMVEANNSNVLDTIYANENMTTALFFPSDIRQGITGSDNFIFTYNRERQQNLGLLKATPGIISNLLVITTKGKVYSYIIKYTGKLKKKNYFISISESIGDEKQQSKKVLEKTEQGRTTLSNNKHNEIDLNIKEQDFLQKSSAALLKLPERENKVKRKKGISLAIKNKVYHKTQVFIQFEIKNNSGIDFDINYLKLYKVNGNKKRKASYQELILKPVLKHNLPGKVRHGETVRFVYVLPKFVLGDNEKLLIELQELNGSRSVSLKYR